MILLLIKSYNEETCWTIESIRDWNKQRWTHKRKSIWKSCSMLWIRHHQQKISVHHTIVWKRKDWYRKADRWEWNVLWAYKKTPTWWCDSDVAFDSIPTIEIFRFYFEIKMKTLWRTKKLIELFNTEMFEIIVEYKEVELPFWNWKFDWCINYELRQKKDNNHSPYKWNIEKTFHNLDEAREYFYKVLEANFILWEIE